MRRYWGVWGLSVFLLVGCSGDNEQVIQRLRSENAQVKKKSEKLQSENAQLKQTVEEFRDSNEEYSAKVQELKRRINVVENADKEVTSAYNLRVLFPEAVPFEYDTWLSLNGGLVSQVKFTSTTAYARYENASAQRVKPDVTIWLFNRDGVVLQKLTDSWIIDSVEPAQSYEQSWSFPSYSPSLPEEIVFSKWARVAWDPKPAYFIVVDSKSACDELLSRARSEIERLNRQ